MWLLISICLFFFFRLPLVSRSRPSIIIPGLPPGSPSLGLREEPKQEICSLVWHAITSRIRHCEPPSHFISDFRSLSTPSQFSPGSVHILGHTCCILSHSCQYIHPDTFPAHLTHAAANCILRLSLISTPGRTPSSSVLPVAVHAGNLGTTEILKKSSYLHGHTKPASRSLLLPISFAPSQTCGESQKVKATQPIRAFIISWV